MCVCVFVGWKELEGACPGVTENYLCLGKSGLVLGLVAVFFFFKYKFNCFLSPLYLPFPTLKTHNHTQEVLRFCWVGPAHNQDGSWFLTFHGT